MYIRIFILKNFKEICSVNFKNIKKNILLLIILLSNKFQIKKANLIKINNKFLKKKINYD